MGKHRKLTPGEEAAWEQRTRDFEAMLKRRQEVDARLRAEREERERRGDSRT
jgi:hypothetical protein